MTTPTQAPGWYPDSYGVVRYWDGYAWTQFTQAPAGQAYGGPHKYVTKSGKHTSHTFHLLMTIFTGGAWGFFVWIPVSIYNAMRHDKHTTYVR